MYGKEDLTRDNILSLITDFDIFKYYCVPFQKIGDLFCSELRKDSRPTCCIFQKNGRLHYKDFGEHSHYFDSFAYVQFKYSLNFTETMKIINNDFRLNLGYYDYSDPIMGHVAPRYHETALNVLKRPTEIRVRIRKWNEDDKNYWNSKYQFTAKDLIEFNVFPLEMFWLNDSLISCDKHCYGFFNGYHEDGREAWKIYQPYRTGNHDKGKWFSNTYEGHLQGFDNLPLYGDKLIITKSLKDVIVLKKLGYNSVAPHGESHKLGSNQVNLLLKRFPNIKVLFDTDAPGQKGAHSICSQWGFQNILLPSFDGKDISDYVEKFGYESAATLLSSYYTKVGE